MDQDQDRPIASPLFSAFNAARNVKMPRWAVPLLTAAAVFHAVLFVTMWIKSVWDIEQLEKGKGNGFDVSVAPAPPPPPPPPPGGVKQVIPPLTPIKRQVRDLIQPVRIEEKDKAIAQVSEITDVVCDPKTEECSEGPGVKDGVKEQPPIVPAALPPPPPPPAPPAIVPPTLLEGSRIAGDKNIIPDDVTKTEIQRSGKDKLVGSYKLCLSMDGNIGAVNQLKSTGFPAYDAKIQREMQGWRYRPYMVNGKAIPVCTAVTFIYSQK